MFEEVLPLVLTLLQRQGWVSYRTLQRRFHLDEATLTALKVELVDRRRLAVDEDGTRLVWQGAVHLLPLPGSQGGADGAPAPFPRGLGPTVVEMPAALAPPPPPAAAAAPHRPTPLVGREQAVALLLRRWMHVEAKRGQVVLLNGEAGIGKSRLVHVVQDQIAPTAHRGWECRCLPYYQHSALYPVIDVVQRLLAWQPEDTPAAKRQRIEAALASYNVPLQKTVPLFAALLSVPLGTHYPPLTLTPERQKHATFAVIIELLGRVASQRPVVLLVEDLHWMDASTGEFLAVLLPQVATMGLYLLLTCRPEFRPAWPPLPHLTALTLNRLLPGEVETLATQVAGGQRLPAAILQQIQARTEGVPLFVEEVTKMVLESGLVPEQDAPAGGGGALPALAIPATVQGSLQARLAHLGAAQTVAQMGAVWGRGFTEAQIRALAGPDQRRVTHALQQLVRADILQEVSLPPQVTYIFKHALMQETAYAALPHALRQQCHQRVAAMLQEHCPETVATQPEVLAQHYTEAGLLPQALAYWQQAGQRALERSAYVEAVAHLTTRLALLRRLPDTPARAQQELDAQTALGLAWMALKGLAAPEVGQAYTRARELCQQVGDTQQLFTVAMGLSTFYRQRGAFQTARELGEECLALAQRAGEPMRLLEAHRVLGAPLFYLGELVRARAHLEQEMALYDPQQHHAHALHYGMDPRVRCLSTVVWALWLLGYPTQARAKNQEALTLAQALSHPYSLAYALQVAMRLHWFRREVPATHASAEALLQLSSAQGFAQWAAAGAMMRGWALAEQNRAEEGIGQMRAGLEAWQAMGIEAGQPYWLTLLAEAYTRRGQFEAGMRLVTEARGLVHKNAERWWEAELHRFQGELLWARAGASAGAPEACFQQALTLARCQRAKSLELRAALSLSRLWQQQGKRTAAYDLLAPVYGWFTEGFDTADLQEAKALLEALGG